MYYILLLQHLQSSEAFTLMMGTRRGKGSLKRSLDPSSLGDKGSSRKLKGANALNNGRGQEITGVSLPSEGAIKGWEFGGGVRMACANVKGELYAVQGDCPRCAFDLWKGDLIYDDPGWDNMPRIACPTCATTYGLRDGKHGPPLKREGFAGFVGGLAKTATQNDAYKDAKAFRITTDDDDRVYCREVF
eukprot:CAMPEP_0178917528 /NCGR_PEP_ID=MMETSP0786-20121207/13296_1 /TAXON_ID=186022 /ORGANISM="Thalassionema frauenfeldii, Strain CCMP 1798" /LENGTH=188 /DNA_ID=CAMNT_0020591087 /DNA_START=81 /DNA_END=647 /DNA_ORIENTATION=+